MGLSFKDLVPFSIIFVVILLAYAQVGILVFGHEDEAFSTVYSALSTELQLFIGGGSELWILEKRNRILGPLYIFSFMVSMGFILFNIFIAILYEARNKQRKNLAPLEKEFEFMSFMKKKFLSFFNKSTSKVDDVSPEVPNSAIETNKATIQETIPMLNEVKTKVDDVSPEVRKVAIETKKATIEEAIPLLNDVKTNQSPEKKAQRRSVQQKSKPKSRLSPEEKIKVVDTIKSSKKIKSQLTGQEAISVFHERIKKVLVMLDILEMELTDEDMQMTQFTLELESYRGSLCSSTLLSSHSSPTSQDDTVSSPTYSPEVSKQLSHVAFAPESEEELQMVFPRPVPNTGGNSRFRPVVMGRLGIDKVAKRLHGIHENGPS